MFVDPLWPVPGLDCVFSSPEKYSRVNRSSAVFVKVAHVLENV